MSTKTDMNFLQAVSDIADGARELLQLCDKDQSPYVSVDEPHRLVTPPEFCVQIAFRVWYKMRDDTIAADKRQKAREAVGALLAPQAPAAGVETTQKHVDADADMDPGSYPGEDEDAQDARDAGLL